MRVIIDTNVLISALLVEQSNPARVVALWRERKFDLLTCQDQLDEMRRVTRYPHVRRLITPAIAGRLFNEVRSRAKFIDKLPRVERAPDPFDDYQLALAEAGKADILVTGDKADLLALKRHGATRIIVVSAFLTELDGARHP